MKLFRKSADFFVPDGMEPVAALSRTTHLGVGAHQDDLEFMAMHGILRCFGLQDQWFSGVTVTDGAGSSRSGIYAACTDEEMRVIRCKEQRNAAILGQYSAQLQLDYPSSAVKGEDQSEVVEDLYNILIAARPQVVYTHNPADKHATHVGVSRALIKALRKMEPAQRPAQVLGCEIWRDLDWLPDSLKVVLDVSERTNISAALSGIFDSQITGGKRYDLAVAGRRSAHATFFESHNVDQSDALSFAMDMTPLIKDDTLSVAAFVSDLIEQFKAEVLAQL
ncbi:MAG: PIG-L family deacetylase [Kiritimatiellae bacterium]|nr:PIG-L family deacetylase [Kiritimatiellia bacterium]